MEIHENLNDYKDDSVKSSFLTSSQEEEAGAACLCCQGAKKRPVRSFILFGEVIPDF
jgi:hypothetical protein